MTHCWTPDERIICGAEDGKVLIFEVNGELKHEFTHVQSMSQQVKSVHVILSFGRGILLGCGGGTVALYERGEEGGSIITSKDSFRKTREFNLSEDAAAITKLAVSPTEEFFLCSTEKSQLYHGTLNSSTF